MSCQQQITQPITTTTTTAATTSVTTEDQDPYVFTETVPTTPPILFNAQKTRTRVFIDTQTVTTTTSRPTPTPNNAPTIATQASNTAVAAANKRPTPAAAASANSNKFKFQQKLPLSPLNGNTTTTKTQTPPSLAVATGHNGSGAAAAATKVSALTVVKQTNAQAQQQQLQQHKKPLNVCIVRPQQQLAPTARQQQQQQQHQLLKAQRKQASSPPPLLQHTPSLWQTPLLLDTTTAVVSPPTSPASLPSPPITHTLAAAGAGAALITPSSTAATALVSPLISATATTLPPSNFHHNTMAQHLQKVECLKKPKKTLAAGNESSGGGKQQQEQAAAMQKLQQMQQAQQKLQQSQSQRRIDFAAKTVVVQPTSVVLPPNPSQQLQQPTQMHKPNVATSSAPPPLQAIKAVPVQQHSDTDLNEIPVNVIFRKPQSSEILQTKLGSNVTVTALAPPASVTNNKSDDTNTLTSTDSGKKVLTHAKSKNNKNVSSKSKNAAETTLSLLPAPHVLRDIVFTHAGTAKLADSTQTSSHTSLPAYMQNSPQHYHASATVVQQQQNMSSMAKLPQATQPQPSLKYANANPAQFALKSTTNTTTVGVKSIRLAEDKCSTDQQQQQRVIATVKAHTMNVTKRKMTVTPTPTACTTPKSSNAMSPFLKKRSRKIGPLYSASDNEMFLRCAGPFNEESNNNVKRAVAVVKLSAAEVEADTTLLASSTVLPYCIQKHWLFITREMQLFGGGDVGGVGKGPTAAYTKGVGRLLTSASERESRITQRKLILRRQALQLLCTHSLQKLPLQAARRRLMCVDRLLRKYEHHGDNEIIAQKQCNYVGCNKTVLEMATQCEDHIVDNISQHIFLPCTAKFADNTQCRIPVFDIIHDLPLCNEHARKRDAYNRAVHKPQPHTSHKLLTAAVASTTLNNPPLDTGDADDLFVQLQQIQQQHKQQQHFYNNSVVGKIKKTPNVKVNVTRKRKASNTTGPNAAARPLKRPKKMVGTLTPTSTPTAVVPAAPLQLTSAVLQRKSSTTSLESIASNSQSSNSQPHYISSNMNIQGGQAKIAMPALAPLSGRNMPVVSSTVSASAPKHTLSFGIINSSVSNDGGNALQDVISQDLKPHEISQLVAQFSDAVGNSSNNRNTNEHCATLNSYSNSSINNSFNSYIGTNCDSNFTSALGSSSSLPSTEELFRQELLSVCENSSVYASSEDTGLGGLSETELMVGPNDADDIPLGDTRLLEEHDLANVLSALPEDAFNELFTAVHQEEREEVERALELADKHLKSLQQTIGTDIDFLGDFPDDDEILADTNAIVSSVMRSPDATSGIDTSTLFIDSGSNSAGAGGGGGGNITDIRGLVQT